MGRRVVTKKRWFQGLIDFEDKYSWFFTILGGALIAVILFMLLWGLPQALVKKNHCTDLGGLYHHGSCFKVSGGIPLG